MHGTCADGTRLVAKSPMSYAESREHLASRILACPDCRSPLGVGDGFLRCTKGGCDRVVRIVDNVFVLEEERLQTSFFDCTHELMSKTINQRGTRCMCYSQQTKWLDLQLDALSSGERVVVDVGCGPSLPYKRSERHYLVGVDLSFESVRRNNEVDLRVFGSATRLPFRDSSVDAIVCFYLLHHLVGRSVRENYLNLERAFSEFARVLKPGGCVYGFEVTPLWPAFFLQRLMWNTVRRVYPQLDMFFWSGQALRILSLGRMPKGTELRRREFKSSPWITFPFVFAWPGLRLPRMMFPFRAYVYEWRTPS